MGMGAAAAGLAALGLGADAAAGLAALDLGVGAVVGFAAAGLGVAGAVDSAGAVAAVRRLAVGADAEAVFAPVDAFLGAGEDAVAGLAAAGLLALALFFAAVFAAPPGGVALRLSALESLCAPAAGALDVLRLDVGVSGCMRAPFRITLGRPRLARRCRPLIA